MKRIPLLGEVDVRFLYREIDVAAARGALDRSTRNALHRFLSSVHLIPNRKLLAVRVGVLDHVILEEPSGSGRFRQSRITPGNIFDCDGRDRLSVLAPVTLELMGRSCGERIWLARWARVISVYKSGGTEHVADDACRTGFAFADRQQSSGFRRRRCFRDETPAALSHRTLNPR